jgi:DNA-binding NarL/FixJ family response regulator
MSTGCARQGILIVEDEPLVSGYILEVLNKFGFPISGCASCGPEAIAIAELNTAGLAIADIQLTGPMDGIEVARILLSRFRISTIFLSGVEDIDTLRRAYAARPLGFLKKPFLPSQLLAVIPKLAILEQSTPSFRGLGEPVSLVGQDG